MTREEAYEMFKFRECQCVKDKDRDSNITEVVDLIFKHFEQNPQFIDILSPNALKDLKEANQTLNEMIVKSEKIKELGIVETLK